MELQERDRDFAALHSDKPEIMLSSLFLKVELFTAIEL